MEIASPRAVVFGLLLELGTILSSDHSSFLLIKRVKLRRNPRNNNSVGKKKLSNRTE